MRRALLSCVTAVLMPAIRSAAPSSSNTVRGLPRSPKNTRTRLFPSGWPTT
jgi:hypothetical protein